MLNTAAMSRIAHGLVSTGTLNSTTLSIAFMEFLNNSDANKLKSLWLSHGFKDVSPIWGNQKQVPTFKSDPATIAQWPDFQEQMTGVEADWYYVSGHHGAQFKLDKLDYAEPIHQVNNHPRTGFFNHEYHEGRWKHGTRNDPHKGEIPHEVFMWSSRDDWAYSPGPQDNPLFNATHDSAKGVFLVGCNSLIYQATRKMWAEYFPNAIIIGTMSREGASIGQIMSVAQEFGREFFTDPKSIDPEHLTWQLNPNQYASDDVLGVIADGILHWSFRGKMFMIGVNDPLRPYHLSGQLPPVSEEVEEDPYA